MGPPWQLLHCLGVHPLAGARGAPSARSLLARAERGRLGRRLRPLAPPCFARAPASLSLPQKGQRPMASKLTHRRGARLREARRRAPSITSAAAGPLLAKSAATACQVAALSLQTWLLAPMTVRAVFSASSAVRWAEARGASGALRSASPPERGGGAALRAEGPGRSSAPAQPSGLLRQWKVLPLIFCFVSGSPALGAASFQLLWPGPPPAPRWRRLPLLLLLSPFSLGQPRFQCPVSLHSQQDSPCCFGSPGCRASAAAPALARPGRERGESRQALAQRGPGALSARP